MPTLEVLETLKKRINEMGDEPRLLKERGESLKDITPSASPVDSDLEQLLGDEVSSGGINEMEALLGSYADDLGEVVQDDSSFPDDFNFDGLDEFDELNDIGADEIIPETLSSDGLENLLEPAGPEGIEESGEPAGPAEIEELSELADLEDVAELSEPAGPEEPESSDGLENLEDTQLPDEDDFSLDDLDFNIDETPEAEQGDTEVPETAGMDLPDDDSPTGAGAGDSDFSLDDLDFNMDEESGEPAGPEDVEELSEPAGPEEPESSDGLENLEDTQLPDEDDFSLDDLDFNIDETPETEQVDTEFSETAGMDLPGDESIPDIPDAFDDVEDLEALEDVEDIESLEETEAPESIPDVESAVEDLGSLDSLDSDTQGELSLDEELNFDEELGADVLSDIKDLEEDSLQFSMDDFGEQYNFKEGDDVFAGELGVDLDKLEHSLDEAAEGEEQPFSIDEEDFIAIRETLATLPRNLKIALEELLADERRKPEDLKPIIDGLIDGESPKVLAGRFRTLTKRKIELPRSYEKRSGQAVADRRASLVYRLVKEGWPVLRTMFLIISFAWVLGAVVFMWVYRPLKANSLYHKGLELIKVDEVERAGNYFQDAWDGWPLFYSEEKSQDRIADSPIVVKGWKINDMWLEYARALRRRKHWDAAMRYYEGFLGIKPESKEIRLEYSRFLSGVLGKYQEAFNLLESAPVNGRLEWDRDYTLAAGDVLLDWAEDDPTRYEEARRRYAKVLEISRNDERAVFSMMRYHLRLNDAEEIEKLIPIFDNEEPGVYDSPELAAEVFSGLGKFRLAGGDVKDARRFIDLAIAADSRAPETSYIDALYWRVAGDTDREMDAYKRTLVNLEGRESLTRQNLKIRILTLGGMGRVQGLSGDISDAAGSYSKAINLYEDARKKKQLGAGPEFGQLYLDMGNIMYQGTEYSSSAADLRLSLADRPESLDKGSERYSELLLAERFFSEAESLSGRDSFGSGLPPESLYRRAYARYELGRNDALLDFHRVARLKPDDYEVRMALAAVLLESGDFEASRSQYARALDLLDEELRRTGGILNPLDKQSHAELLLRYIIAWNNLGVGRARSAARGGGGEDYAAALSAFTMASEYYDEVYTDMPDLISRGAMAVRDPDDRRITREDSGRRVLEETMTLPYLNRMRLLGLESAGEGEDSYLMYPDIPSDLRVK